MPEWFNVTTLMAVLAGISTFAVALKATPSIWSSFKDTGKFLSGLELTSTIPGLLKNQETILESNIQSNAKIDATLSAISDLSNELQEHMVEEERLREREKSLIESLMEQVKIVSSEMALHSSKVANTVFRQAVFADPIAYYTIERGADGEWDWTWGNAAYLNLTGLMYERARAGHYWDIIEPTQRDWVIDVVKMAGEEGKPLDVEFTLVNAVSGATQPVRVISWPLHDHEGNACVYLGAIQVYVDVAK